MKKKLKIAILSTKRHLYSTARLVEAAKHRGHEVHVINTLRCYMNITAERPSIHYQGKALDNYDAVIPRIGASVTFYGAALVRLFETNGVFCVNGSLPITRARDKLRCLQLLARKNIGLPVTGFAHSPDDIDDLIKLVGGAPLVIKLLEGTQGIGVVLAETKNAARSVIDAFLGIKANILLQEYVKEAGGADIRCFVVDGKVIAAMQRQAPPGEFRSNLHRGGHAQPVSISEAERVAAVRAAKVMGLNVAGVDILRSERGPLVMEVNASPGLRGIESTTGIDAADLIVEFIEREVKKHPRRKPAEK
jgi:ribosomal protein S6--L-glutamate ligase